MRLHLATLAAAASLAAATLTGCVIDPYYSEPIQIPAGYVPPSYSTQGRVQPSTRTTDAYVPPFAVAPSTAAVAPNPATAAQPPVIDDAVRDQVVDSVQTALARRFPADPDPQLGEYLMLVGSLLTITSPQPDVEYRYVLLNTDEPVSFAVWPKSICVSRGLVKRMEDESELAGVIAREMSNLQSGRTLQAAGLPAATQPATRPATTKSAAAPQQPASAALADVQKRAAARLTGVLLREPPDPTVEQAADLDGARLAAAAKYAPDGFLKLLTRLKPAGPTTAATTAAWDRIKALDANVQIVAKAHPNATSRLPARFEGYVKPTAKPDAAANP